MVYKPWSLIPIVNENHPSAGGACSKERTQGCPFVERLFIWKAFHGPNSHLTKVFGVVLED